MLKKKFISVLVIVAVVVAAVVSASAVSTILKEKNIFQIAADVGIDITQLNEAEDFKYTPIDSVNIPLAIDTDENQGGETFEDAKTNIYNKMLNSIDHFNNVVLIMETSMLGEEITTVEYQVDINSNLAYQVVSENAVVVNETYSEADNMIFVNNSARTYIQKYLPTYDRGDSPYISLGNRITTASDGIPCYSYRRNITNCPLASYCVVPQEITFSYLKDFDKWEIADDNFTYLDRNCIRIIGTPSPYIAAKHNIDSFEMIVDSTTGILMKFTGTLSGNVERYMTVTSCSFESRAVIKQFNLDDYSTYTEIFRNG